MLLAAAVLSRKGQAILLIPFAGTFFSGFMNLLRKLDFMRDVFFYLKNYPTPNPLSSAPIK